jgi:hypothetical protein
LGSLAADLVVERERVHENDELPLAALAVEGECQVGRERSVVALEVWGPPPLSRSFNTGPCVTAREVHPAPARVSAHMERMSTQVRLRLGELATWRSRR